METGLLLEVAFDGSGEAQCAPEHVAIAMEAVFPLCQQVRGRRWRFIGTAFFINHMGIFATARHVLTEFENQQANADKALCGFVVLQDDSILMLPVINYANHPIADVAVGRLAVGRDKNNKAIRQSIAFQISLGSPPVNSKVFTFAYPRTEIDNTRSPQEFKIAPWFYSGCVEAHFPAGRDSVMLPGDVYQTTIDIHGGASGGPVFGPDGKVIGINSTGIAGSDVSFVSSIRDILPLPLGGLRVDGKLRGDITVQDLIRLGALRLPDHVP